MSYDDEYGVGWLFLAIRNAQGKDAEVGLNDVIGTASYIARVTPNYREVNHACTKLLNLGFISIQESKISVTNSGREFISNIELDEECSGRPWKYAAKIAAELAKLGSTSEKMEIFFSSDEIRSAADSSMSGVAELSPGTVVFIDATDP